MYPLSYYFLVFWGRGEVGCQKRGGEELGKSSDAKLELNFSHVLESIIKLGCFGGLGFVLFQPVYVEHPPCARLCFRHFKI